MAGRLGSHQPGRGHQGALSRRPRPRQQQRLAQLVSRQRIPRRAGQAAKVKVNRLSRLAAGFATTIVAALAASVSDAATLCAYRDYMPAYAKLYAETRMLTPKARGDAFVERYAAAHPDFYLP